MLQDLTRHEPLAKASVAPADASVVLQQELLRRECRETRGPAVSLGVPWRHGLTKGNLPDHMVEEQTADDKSWKNDSNRTPPRRWCPAVVQQVPPLRGHRCWLQRSCQEITTTAAPWRVWSLLLWFQQDSKGSNCQGSASLRNINSELKKIFWDTKGHLTCIPNQMHFIRFP